ncbi:MAG: F0F1 ATP synthase subunit A [Phycisphaerae bacterium]|nr:F0F1 ATP synthase subunit A [Phycisphaerae bacterium]
MNPLLLASGLDPLHHVVDKPVYGTAINLSVVMLVVGGLVTMWMLWLASRRIATGPASEGNERYVSKGRLAQLVEVTIVYLRDEMLTPVLGAERTRRYLPFLLTQFFFILVLNVFGLIPMMDMQTIVKHLIGAQPPPGEDWVFFGGTATASLSVTGALAIFSFIVIQAHGFKELGVKGWLEHLCGGHDLVAGPKALWLIVPLIFVVEFMGLFIKPAALAIRLFANMVGGHTLLATLLLFGAMALNAGMGMVGVGSISVAAVIFAVLISFLEIFVALLQAFIFMFLTAVFISTMSHHDEEHEGHEEHAHAPQGAAGHGHAAPQAVPAHSPEAPA